MSEQPEVHTITFRPESLLCEVTAGPNRHIYLSNRYAVGMALLREGDADEATAQASAIRWADMLVSHGVAVGRNRQEQVILAVVPETKRTVNWTGPVYPSHIRYTGDTRSLSLTITVPPLLVMLRTKEQRYVRAYLHCVAPTALKTLTVNTASSVLATFPYGNVYVGGGRICWGNVAHATLNTVEDVLYAFFSSGFNIDLYHPATCGSTARTLHEMANAAQGMLPPPVAASFNMTVAGQLHRLMGMDE